MANRQNNELDNYRKSTNGQYGHRFINSGNTSPSGEYYVAIEAWEDSVISYDSNIDPEDRFITSDEFGGDVSQTSLTINEGKLIAGSMTNVEVISGKVLVYLK